MQVSIFQYCTLPVVPEIDTAWPLVSTGTPSIAAE